MAGNLKGKKAENFDNESFIHSYFGIIWESVFGTYIFKKYILENKRKPF